MKITFMLNRLRYPAIWFFAASLLGLLQIYYAIRGDGWRLSLGALAYGLVLGFVVQLCFRQPLPKVQVAVASFCGAFILWLPVVAVTYGFALMATPVFFAYSATVIVGAYMAVQLHRACKAKNGA
jgi:hypothetical protein